MKGDSVRRIVFVMSAGHSGSTLLDLLLGSHSEGFSLGELGSLPRRMGGGELPEALCGICEDGCEVWDRPELRRFLSRHFRWAISRRPLLRALDARAGGARGDLYGRVFDATGASFLVDSGKRVAWVRRQLAPAWQWRRRRAHLIYLHRDGRGVVNSLRRKYPERGAEAITRQWAGTVHAMESFYARFPPSRRSRVAYEALATDPEATLERLCGEIGVVFEPAMLAYWRHPHHIVHGNAGTRSLIHRYRAEAEGGEAEERAGFYRRLGLGIHLDLRWREELAAEDLATFEAVAGALNEPYRYRGGDAAEEEAPEPTEAAREGESTGGAAAC